MNRNKCLLIINPVSGTASKVKRDVPVRAVSRLYKAGIDLEIRYTKGPGHGRELARAAAASGYLGVIAAGGDGTVNEIAQALLGTDTALGIIPLGSGNGLARHIGLSLDVSEALNVIARRNITPCDCCTANGRYFFCTFGLGFDAAVSEKFSTLKGRGLLNYLRSALLEYLKYTPREYEIVCNGRTQRIKAFIVSACNASQYGNNAFIAPAASIRDGLVDITVVHAGTPFTRAFFGVDLLTGTVKNKLLVQTFRAKELIIRRLTPGKSAHIDGEPVAMENEVEVKCLPGKLLMFTKEDKRPFRPLLTPMLYMHRELWSRVGRLFGR